MYNHITWENDSMVVVFPSHNGDKEGKRCSTKHVYANVAEPSVRPKYIEKGDLVKVS